MDFFPFNLVDRCSQILFHHNLIHDFYHSQMVNHPSDASGLHDGIAMHA